MGKAKCVMVAATKQHCGKTSTALALIAGLKKMYNNVGFQKPVGQRHVHVEGLDENGVLRSLRVDKDVSLFKEYFDLKTCNYRDMSPVVIPSGYTRDFLDGKISEMDQLNKVQKAYANLELTNDFILLEGTGHCGVGSIVNLDNARVASFLKADMILIVNGGLGSAFDELALNRLMCKHHNVNIRGVIVNKIQPDKIDMIREYFDKALKRWDIPLIGCVPDGPSLSEPTMLDIEAIFKTKLLSGKEHRLRHYNKTSLIAAGLRFFMERLNVENHSRTLFITHASRKDIILGFLAHSRIHQSRWGEPFEAGLILCGGSATMQADEFSFSPNSPPDPTGLTEILKESSHPVVYVSNLSTYDANAKLLQYTAKLSAQDIKRTTKCIEHYSPHIDFSYLRR